jgi:hypothetical protein
VILLASGLVGQTPAPPSPIEVAYSTNAANGRILRLDFATGVGTVVNTDSGQRKRLQGLAVRDDGVAVHLLVCDSADGTLLFYADAAGAGEPITTEIPSPDGVSLDVAGNAYLVGASQLPAEDVADGDSSFEASAIGSAGQVWWVPRNGRRPGGYGTPVLIDGNVPSSKLEDTMVVPFTGGGLRRGDLLVASRRPPAIFRYRRCDPEEKCDTGFGPREVFVARSAFRRTTRLTGLAFAPNRDLLVSTFGGAILRFDASGRRRQPDFAPTAQQNRLDIAVGVQDGKNYAFVTNRGLTGGDNVQRLLIGTDGTGKPAGSVVEQVIRPHGVGLASSQGAPTPTGGCPTGPPACPGVEAFPAPEVELTFDHVLRAGITTARIIEFVDNRLALHGTYVIDQSLKDFFPKGSPLEQQLPDVIVPANVQAFRKGDPFDGVPTFLLAIMDTTALFRRTVEFHYEEADQLGYPPPCTDLANPTRETRTFYVPDPRSERLKVEGPVFTDISSACGSNIGRGDDFSFYLTARSLRLPAEIADGQFDHAFQALDPDFYPCIDVDVRAELLARLGEARAAFEEWKTKGDPAARDKAIDLLHAFIAAVDKNPGGFSACGTNVAGELVSRALAILYNVPKVQPGRGLQGPAPAREAAMR